jgi:hypothetical protein
VLFRSYNEYKQIVSKLKGDVIALQHADAPALEAEHIDKRVAS